MPRFVVAMLLVALTLGGCSFGDDPTTGIWVVDADGSNARLLVRAELVEPSQPRWSPDGRWIAFVGADATSGGNRTTNDVIAAEVDGPGRVNLTREIREQCIGHDWSPDGTRIGVWRLLDGGAVRNYTVNADGTAAALLAEVRPLTALNSIYPGIAWSPNGDRITFVSTGPPGDLFVVGVDGANLTNLTDDAALQRDPAWSPDGSLLAFVTGSHWLSSVEIAAADGSERRRLTTEAVFQAPGWSPDGRRLVVARAVADERGGIVVMRADGADAERLTDGWSPSWSPDGSPIVFVARSGVYAIDADGSHRTKLTKASYRPADPRWSPDGRRLAFSHHSPSD